MRALGGGRCAASHLLLAPVLLEAIARTEARWMGAEVRRATKGCIRGGEGGQTRWGRRGGAGSGGCGAGELGAI